MTDHTVLTEVALNKREVSHRVWGGPFFIRRPTSRVLSKIDTVQTRAYNRDLQTKERIYDSEDPSKSTLVPAFFTRAAKEKLLKEHGDWTEEDRQRTVGAEDEYRKVCFELDSAGYVGMDFLLEEYKELSEELKAILGKNADKYEKELRILIPLYNDNDLSAEDASVEDFLAAKKVIDKAAKSAAALVLLDRLGELHKQYKLYIQGISAQTKLFTLKLKEISLFADTVEARSEKEGQLVKIFECVEDTDGNKLWKNVNACEDSSPEFLGWLLQEVEKFERLDPAANAEEDPSKNRFNFLSQLGGISTLLGDSQDPTESNEDGESQMEVQLNSSTDLDTTEKN